MGSSKRQDGASAQGGPRRRAFEAATTGLVLAGLAGGVWSGVPWLERHYGRSVVLPERVVIAAPGEPGPPAWLPHAVADQLVRAAGACLAARPDPLSAIPLRDVAETLTRTGWFERVLSVRRQHDQVRADVLWRVPAAAVRSGDRDYPVSERGEILPLAYRVGESGLPVIVGVPQPPPRVGARVAVGGLWPGDEVSAGLALLALVRTRSWAHQVAAVDVSEYAAHRRLVLISAWGGRAVWGAPPHADAPGEVGTDVKVRRLDALARRFGRIDAGRRLVEVAGPVLLVDDSATASVP